MRWRSAQTTAATALTLLALAAVVWLLTSGGKSRHDPHPAGRASGAAAPAVTQPTASADPAAPSTVYATVRQTPSGPPLSPEFLGLSLEYTALDAYTGANPAALDPVFVQLLRNLATTPGQQLVLRIGGNSTDSTWWPVRGLTPAPGVRYALNPAWLTGARALANAVPAKLILGVNLAAKQPRLSAAEADALVHGIGASSVTALELGNEPDVYDVFPWYSAHHRPVYARGAGFDLSAFIAELKRWDSKLPDLPLAGPAVAELPWLSGISALADAAPRLRIVTAHRYALQGCFANRSSPLYPSVTNLLSDRSSAGLAQALVPYVTLAHSRGLHFRVDELNSAALAGCLGRTGVSNTFASALWMLDTLFDMARVGVDGVNVHSLPGAGYEPFTFSRANDGRWQAFVHPDYYGMLMFAQAFPAGARLLRVSGPAGPVKVWATIAPDGQIRVALINQDSQPHRVELQLPPAGGPAELEWLRAPSPTATAGVTLGGRSFGLATRTGRLPAAPVLQRVSQLLGFYSIDLPAYSAALLTR